MTPLRVVSLLPSATEIVASLGFENALVGRSHECDFPPGVERLPVCTAPKLDASGSTEEIHARVEELLSRSLSVYRVDAELLRDLSPTHVVTQVQCEVCAVSLEEVERALVRWSPPRPLLIPLNASSLKRYWRTLRGWPPASDPRSGEGSFPRRCAHASTKSRARPDPARPVLASRRSSGSHR